MAVVPRVQTLPSVAKLSGTERQEAFVRRVWPWYRKLAPYAFPRWFVFREAGTPLPWDSIADVFTAHAAAETGWGIGLYNWNFGNIQAAADSGTPYAWKGDAFEQVDHMPDPKAEGGEREYTALYRAYPSQKYGAADHLKYIARHAPSAFLNAAIGGGEQFFSRLRSTGYFSGRVYVHGDETTPRLDSDGELDAQFAVNLRIVRRVTAAVRSTPQRAALGALALYGTVLAFGFAGIYKWQTSAPRRRYGLLGILGG